MTEDLIKFWKREFNDFEPEAHNLKNEYKSRWVRFHSLPESKRYPENEAEYKEVLRRHNLLLHELLGNRTDAFVVLPEYSESKRPTKPEAELDALFPVSEFWRSLNQGEDGDELYWHLHVAKLEFTGRELDCLFRLVANDEARNIMIIDSSKNVVYHPYDGGADVVLGSSKQRDILKKRDQEWLSQDTEGL